MRVAREVTLPLTVDRSAATALPDQLVEQLRGLLAGGVLTPGDDLPATRALAAHLGVARGTVVTAYDQLVAEGWFVGTPGRSVAVNPRLPDVHPGRPGAGGPVGAGQRASLGGPGASASPEAKPAEVTRTPPGAATIDLRPGRPMQAGVVDAAWRAAWRRASGASLDVPMPPFGWPPLRAAIAQHLRRMRAVVADPERILITAGGREGLATLLAAARVRSVGVEDPGFPSLRRVLDHLGLAACPLPADAHGLVTEHLPHDPPDSVIVTPSHQYPLGGSLPVERRQQLLAWAGRYGVLVVEDDYDSELRYSSAPLPALTSLDADGSVALLGTFAKTLTPSLTTGYVVVPEHLVAAVRAARLAVGQPVNLVTQRALADYLDAGALGRHTQRMRQLYRRRRDLVVRTLRPLVGVRVSPMDGGLHAVVEHELDEGAVVEALAARGVRVGALSAYWATTPSSRRGLVFGFGAPSDDELARGLEEIASALSRGPESSWNELPAQRDVGPVEQRISR